MSIQVVGADEVIQRFEQLGPKAMDALSQSVAILVLKLKRHIAQGKLTGQTLHVRTGTLRRSILDSGKVFRTGSAVIGSVNTNVKYGRVHEFGGSISVPAHLRLVKQAWGKELKFPVWSNVRAHQATYPERSFMRTALADMKDEIVRDMTEAVRSTL